MISEATMPHQMPITPKMSGKRKTKAICKTSVRIKEIKPEIIPLFNAVKKEEKKIDIPQKRKTIEKILIAVALHPRQRIF